MNDINLNGSDYSSRYRMIFDNRIELLEAKEFCRLFGYKISTIYDWKYRPKKNKIPDDLFVKFRNKLHLRTDVLRKMLIFAKPLTQRASRRSIINDYIKKIKKWKNCLRCKV